MADLVVGIAGAVVVAHCEKRLIADTGKVLLDREIDHLVVAEIKQAVKDAGHQRETTIADLHVWRVDKANYSCAISLVTHDRGLTPGKVNGWLAQHEEIVDSTIEIHCGKVMYVR